MEILHHRQLLDAFEKISRHGEREADGYRLDGILATAGYDGYSLTFTDGRVTASLLFHNTIACDSSSRAELKRFVDRIEAICREYC